MAGSLKTNNDKLMQKTGLMIVYAWVMLAVGFFVLTAWDPTYLASSEDYVSILAIIGGPALLIVTKILETWNQEKQAELQDYESQAGHLRDMEEIKVRHQADMERNPHCHDTTHEEDRMESLESDLATAIAEIVMLKEEINSGNRGKRKE